MRSVNVPAIARLSVFVLFSLASMPAIGDDADDGDALRTAARAGDLATVQRLLDSGIEADAADRWNTTALQLASAQGHVEIVRTLLERGAAADQAETFFGSTPLGRALEGGHFEIAEQLIAAGAPERARTLYVALRGNRPRLARAAAEAGPILVSEKARLAAELPQLGDELRSILERVETVPDPAPPAYTAEELRAFTGSYEGWDSGSEATVTVADGRLTLQREGHQPIALKIVGDQRFRADDGTGVSFFGRAGTIEGIGISSGSGAPVSLRRSVADPDPDLADRLRERRQETIDAETRPTVHWPGFRGENARGIGDGRPTATEWDLEDGAGVAWKAELPGLGNSSPVVWGDRVFVSTAVASEGDQSIETGLTGSGQEVEEAVEHRWLVIAFDKRSGEKIWETEVGRAVPLTKRHIKATQANSTPAVDGEHLVGVFPTAGLACLGLDGDVHWRHELGGLNAGGFNDPGLQWGFASSPLLHEGRVILQVDIHDGAYLAAWDLRSGRELWRTERPDVAPSWATPVIWPTAEGDQIVTNASTIHGYDPDTGRELWSLGPSSVQVVATPLLGDGVVYVGAGYPPVKPIYAVEPSIAGDVEVEPGHEHPALRWSHDRGGAYMPTPLLYRGLLYVVHHNGRLVAYEPSTGEAVYKSRFSRAGTFTASPVANNGRIYTGTEEGLLYVIAAGPDYRELAVHVFDEPLMATPAISEGLLLVRTPTTLWALGEVPPRGGPSSSEPASRAAR